MKPTAEDPPDVIRGPAFDMSTPDGTEALLTWLLEQHVGLCAKGGVDCRTCEDAGAKGIARPA